MNRYAARKRSDADLWEWTRENDGVTLPSGACADRCGHATREEAERHQWEWETAEIRQATANGSQHPCKVCGKWTQTSGTTRDYGGAMVTLCEAHCNPEGYRQVRPFEPGITVTSSY